MEFLRSVLEWIVSLVAPLVAPDWAALIRLIPIGVLLLVAGFYLWVLLRYRRAGRRRVGARIRTAHPPAGIHLPGPSLAPLLVSAAAGALFFSVALGGAALALSAALLVLALLAWGREAVREYDTLDAGHGGGALAASTESTATVGPPEGVHLPPPSLLPLLVSLSAAVLLFGVAVGAPIALLGGLMTALALVGWLVDAGREYRAAIEADLSGHLVSPAPRRAPLAAIVLLSILFVVVGGAQAGILPPKFGEASPAPSGDGGSPAPSDGSAASGGDCGGGGALSSNPSAASGVKLEVVAEGVKFGSAALEAPADAPFSISFENRDAGIPHNVAIHVGAPNCVGAELWKGAIFAGVATQTYDVPALSAGSYAFVCTVHPNMAGVLTVK